MQNTKDGDPKYIVYIELNLLLANDQKAPMIDAKFMIMISRRIIDEFYIILHWSKFDRYESRTWGEY